MYSIFCGIIAGFVFARDASLLPSSDNSGLFYAPFYKKPVVSGCAQPFVLAALRASVFAVHDLKLPISAGKSGDWAIKCRGGKCSPYRGDIADRDAGASALGYHAARGNQKINWCSSRSRAPAWECRVGAPASRFSHTIPYRFSTPRFPCVITRAAITPVHKIIEIASFNGILVDVFDFLRHHCRVCICSGCEPSSQS